MSEKSKQKPLFRLVFSFFELNKIKNYFQHALRLYKLGLYLRKYGTILKCEGDQAFFKLKSPFLIFQLHEII